ncbi:uncharacterized protein B0H18DRAFT_636709 [Fomitopsis serialis]|uniref:uncharacterized protein n=1 Tax=Fomitopsis serialis TaxID=139415 RepID=UPI002008D66B|nr:uncharacterized protein B0H18DRAFT_636709 [Neoantrodia serialis]KAH9919415.1 hypothetical protein B0H18DRAFT_636709 [Neoantrodia serialis]
MPFEHHESVHMLFGPQLSTLHMGVWSSDFAASQAVPQVLVHLPFRSPDIHELTIHMYANGGPDDQRLPSKVFASLIRLKSLTLLSTLPLEPDVFTALSALPHLTEAKITIHSGDEDACGLLGADHAAAPSFIFRALESLTLTFSLMSDINTILSACSLPQLRRLSLTSLYGSDSSMFDRTLQLIRDHCSHAMLEVIELRTTIDLFPSMEFEEVPEPDTITAASLGHLFAFHRIRELELLTEMYIALDDDDLKEMAMSWPRLKSLQLQSVAEEEPGMSVTLEGLAHLARYCPAMNWLAIDVDTTGTFVSPDARPGGGYCNQVLQAVDFQRSHASDCPAEIGAFLYAIFPKLQWINSHDDTPGEDSWKPVEDMLGALRKMSQWPRNTVLPRKA